MTSIRTLADDLTGASPWLDSVARLVHQAWDPLFGSGGPAAVKNALYGTWLGHPLHPAVTDVPIGFWTAGMLFDVAHLEEAADLAIGVGTVSSLGAVVTGYAQWHDLQEEETPRRLGILHAILNAGAIVLYGTSWLLRRRGRRTSGIALSLVGGSVATVSALLGGDLAFRLGIGVSRDAFETTIPEWTPLCDLADLEDATPRRLDRDGAAIVLLRQGDEVVAASAICTHLGGPLDEGTVEGSCVTCPWHGSRFDLADGRVIDGPATSALQCYRTRVRGGRVEVITATK